MISICMIVKNEEPILDECLKKLSELNYEIIVVDTGSTDKSKEIAFRYTKKVFDYKWNNSFSDARNFAIDKAEGDFILMIDSDEVVSDYDKNVIENLCRKNEKYIGRLTRINSYTRDGIVFKYKDYVGRLFSKKYFKYEGNIHEQLVPLKNDGISFYNIPLEVIHSGYEEDEITRKRKSERNIKMLKDEIEFLGKNPYLLYQLGKSYYMDNNYEDAWKNFYEALEYDLDIKLEYVEDLVECYGYCYINLGKYNEALNLLNIYDEFSGSSDFVFLIALVYMNNSMFIESIREFKKASSMTNGKMLGVNSFLAYYNIAVIYECLGEKDEAVKHYEKCGCYELAEKRLKLILQR